METVVEFSGALSIFTGRGCMFDYLLEGWDEFDFA